MGKGAGKFMMDSSAFYNEIFDLREGGTELLSDDNFKSLPDNTFVFWMHQGYQFAFFYLDQGGNPPVNYYLEEEHYEDFERTEQSLTDFLEKQLLISGLG